MRLTNRAAAILLASAGALLMGVSAVTGHNAHSEAPRNLAPAKDLDLDVWKAAQLRITEPGALFLDAREAESFAQYHLPFSASLPGAAAKDILAALDRAQAVVIVGALDNASKSLVQEVRAERPGSRVYYLKDGARAWFTAFDMPVPLFLDKPAPSGYESALATVKTALTQPDPTRRASAEEALQTLSRLNVQPEFAKATAKPAADDGGKKIVGGCG
jgi:rhodanese-related sulfurtransferase